jgi:hypothetical protein
MNRTRDDVKFCRHYINHPVDDTRCSLPAFAHGECESHFWRDCSCGHQSTHSWAGTESDPAGDVALMCDLCFMEFVLAESRDGIFLNGWEGEILHRQLANWRVP